MGVVAHQGPGVDRCPAGRCEIAQPIHEIASILVVINDVPPLDPSDHHMVERPWTIEPGLPWHRLPPPSLLAIPY